MTTKSVKRMVERIPEEFGSERYTALVYLLNLATALSTALLLKETFVTC